MLSDSFQHHLLWWELLNLSTCVVISLVTMVTTNLFVQPCFYPVSHVSKDEASSYQYTLTAITNLKWNTWDTQLQTLYIVYQTDARFIII